MSELTEEISVPSQLESVLGLEQIEAACFQECTRARGCSALQQHVFLWKQKGLADFYQSFNSVFIIHGIRSCSRSFPSFSLTNCSSFQSFKNIVKLFKVTFDCRYEAKERKLTEEE